MPRIGIFAGTFDPVHHGHIAFCLAAAEKCDLDAVYLLPERMPRGKQMVSDFIHREALLDLAVENIRKLKVLTLNSDFFTVDSTLPALQKLFPDAKLSFLIGSDVACKSLGYWRDLDKLLSSAEIIVGVREDNTTDEVQQCMEHLGSTHPELRCTIIQSPHSDVSSSKIRAKTN